MLRRSKGRRPRHGSTIEASDNRLKRALADLETQWHEADDVARPVRAYLEQMEAEADGEREGPER